MDTEVKDRKMIEQVQIIISDDTLTDAEKLASIRSALTEESTKAALTAASMDLGEILLMASFLHKERRGYIN